MELSIRSASEKDIQEILSLLYELGRPKPVDTDDLQIFENRIRDYFVDTSKRILIAEMNSTVVGLASVIFLRRLNRSKSEMYIPELVVRNDLRYSGIGKKLIAHCIELGKKKNCYRIRLESGNQRKESHRFYTDLGFEQSGLSFSKSLL